MQTKIANDKQDQLGRELIKPHDCAGVVHVIYTLVYAVKFFSCIQAQLALVRVIYDGYGTLRRASGQGGGCRHSKVKVVFWTGQ